MPQNRYCIPFPAPALEYAAGNLEKWGCTVVREPDEDVTHLLLGVPTGTVDDRLRGVLERLPEHILIFGGNLPEELTAAYPCVDLLEDPEYLAFNGAITAQCAIRLAAGQMNRVWLHCPVLVLGWGRIGKLLAGYLKGLGADVTVAARRAEHRAMLRAMGYDAVTLPHAGGILPHCRVIFNTIPAPILTQDQTALCQEDAVLLDLASTPGMAGPKVQSARGLPGKMAPESSGALIARRVLALGKGVGVQ